MGTSYDPGAYSERSAVVLSGSVFTGLRNDGVGVDGGSLMVSRGMREFVM